MGEVSPASVSSWSAAPSRPLPSAPRDTSPPSSPPGPSWGRRPAIVILGRRAEEICRPLGFSAGPTVARRAAADTRDRPEYDDRGGRPGPRM